MADIVLSAAVRNNLLSLQNTADLLGTTQERLATGLKVNSALDDPSAFFTASSLTSRSGDLNRLLDSVGLAVQTLEAADTGISAITDLVEAAEAAARQARQASGPQTTSSVTGAASATFNPAALAAVAGTTAALTADAIGTLTFTDATIGAETDFVTNTTISQSDVLVLSVNGTDQTITFGTGGGEVNTGAALETAIDNLTGVDAAYVGGALVISGETGDDTFTLQVATTDAVTTELGGIAEGTSETGRVNLLTQSAVAQGETLSITIGSATKNITFGTGANEISTLAELNTELATVLNGSASVNTANGNISVTAADAANSITLGGSATLGNFGLTAGEFSNLIGGTGAPLSQGDTLTVQVGANTPLTLTFGTAASEVNTLAELTASLGTLAGGTASIDGTTGAISVSATNTANDITISEGGAGEAAVFGLTTGVFASVTTNSAERSERETEFNNLLTQIDQLARDAGFNGINLLQSDNLDVIFNEDSTSLLTIQGVDFDSGGLGINIAALDSFQTNANIDTTLTELDTAINTLRSQAATFGGNLSVVEVRQQFTKELSNVLDTGAAGLTLADTNEEGANLLALQTRQQLSTVALSLASQADQQVLRLF